MNRDKQFYENHKEEVKAQRRQYYWATHEMQLERRRRYWRENKDMISRRRKLARMFKIKGT